MRIFGEGTFQKVDQVIGSTETWRWTWAWHVQGIARRFREAERGEGGGRPDLGSVVQA
jgi:hypothetical protein